MSATRRAASGAALAFSLLTIVPLRTRPDARGLRPAAVWFPIVGAAVGAIAGGVLDMATHPFGPAVAAVLATATLVVLTGGLHQDGLADCADAIGVRGGRDRTLAVMREPTIGTFGALALLLWAILLVTALAELPRHDALPTLVLACALGRWAALTHAATSGPARRDGLGAAFAAPPFSVAVATAMVLGGGLLLESARGLAACASALLLALAVSGWARRTLGGRTGDTLGAVVVLAEVAACLTVLAFAGHPERNAERQAPGGGSLVSGSPVRSPAMLGSPFDFDGRNALVTGCGSAAGIGFASARLLARLGARLAITSTTDRIEERAAELRAEGASVSAHVADLTDRGQAFDLVAAAQAAHGPLHVLVHAAGMIQTGTEPASGRFAELRPEVWHRSLDLNLNTAFHTAQAILSGMVDCGYGRIVLISSVTGPFVTAPGDAAYATAKAAMDGMMRTLALEYGRAGITVNSVAPGWIATASATPLELEAGRSTPVGRPGTADEVASLVAYLASEPASYVTGQSIVVDGGNLIQEPHGVDLYGDSVLAR